MFKDLPEGQTHYCLACEQEKGKIFTSTTALVNTCGKQGEPEDIINPCERCHSKPKECKHEDLKKRFTEFKGLDCAYCNDCGKMFRRNEFDNPHSEQDIKKESWEVEFDKEFKNKAGMTVRYYQNPPPNETAKELKDELKDFIRAKIKEAYNAGGKRMGEIMKEEMEIEIPKIKKEARSQLIKEVEEMKKEHYTKNYDKEKWGNNYEQVDNLARDAYNQAIDEIIKLLTK